MKKSLLNITITIAISSAVFSGSVISSQVYAEDLISADNNSRTTETYMLPGLGAGAATGAVVAGPAGFLIGGIIGALVGSNQEVSNNTGDDVIAETALEPDSAHDLTISTTADDVYLTEDYIDDLTSTSPSRSSSQISAETTKQEIQLAQLGEPQSVLENNSRPIQDTLLNVLTGNLSLDVYFRSGSTDIESFYPSRLSAIADLMHNIDQLQVHLDGYTDRRGNKSQNITLANERIEKVRQQLIHVGVAENRIITKAFGEMKMVSSAGDLEGYTFDRKVVIRFERTSPDSISSMATALSNFATEETTILNNEKSLSPVVAETNSRFKNLSQH